MLIREAAPLPTGTTGLNLSEEVYNRLRSDILRGVLRPNEALVEAEIAERLKVSRTPVRESLQRLASEGFIVSRRRRWVVYEHSRAEIVELYEIRAALEAYAARLAAQRATEEQIQSIKAARPFATAVDLTGRERVDANEKFHDLIIAASNNRRLADLIQRNRLYAFNYTIAALYSTEHMATSSRQHGELIDAIVARDSDRAERIAREHVEYSLGIIVERAF